MRQRPALRRDNTALPRGNHLRVKEGAGYAVNVANLWPYPLEQRLEIWFPEFCIPSFCQRTYACSAAHCEHCQAGSCCSELSLGEPAFALRSIHSSQQELCAGPRYCSIVMVLTTLYPVCYERQ